MMFEVDQELQALIMECQKPEMLTLLPNSFELAPGFIGVPHTLDTCIRLAAMGYTPPSPMEYQYHWPHDKTFFEEPFSHQIKTSGFAAMNPHCYILNGMGTGKTLSAAWLADYLIECGYGPRVLIVSPLSTLERVWGDALFIHFRHRSFAILHGAAAKRKKLLAEKKDFYVINHAGVGVIAKELGQRPDIDIIIIDEVAVYRNKQTDMWKAINGIIYPGKEAKPKTYVIGLTGAPIPNSPEDAYGQCKLVTPHTVPQYFTGWRNMVMEHQSTYVWTPRREATKIVYEAMRPAIRFSRDECLDLPPCVYQTRDVEMSSEQARHYKQVMKELSTEVQGGKVTAMNEGVKLSKLLQIACGVVYDSAGVAREIDCGNRVEVLMEIIEQVSEKVIVFVPFTAVTGMLYRELSKYWEFAVVTGETPIKERDQIFSRFQDPNSKLDIVAHPGCMAHGLTLTEASTIIWYAPIDSNDIYGQANARITRPGQKFTANIVNMAGSAVERRSYKRLELRQSNQGLLLDMIARGER